MGTNIKINGIEELMKRLDALPAIRSGIKTALIYLKGKIAIYPPSTEANSPDNSTGRWYQRGYGSKWHTKSGIHGKQTSEALGRSWTKKIAVNGLSGSVGNDTSYGPYVQDRDHQSPFHKRNGWKTVQDVSEDELDNVQEIIKNYVDEKLNGIDKQSPSDS